MSLDIIAQAVIATHAIDDILTEARLDISVRSYDAYGAYLRPALVKESIERARRRLTEAIQSIEATQWPTAAHYEEV